MRFDELKLRLVHHMKGGPMGARKAMRGGPGRRFGPHDDDDGPGHHEPPRPLE